MRQDCGHRTNAEVTVTGGRTDNHCANQDGSVTKHSALKGGGGQAANGPSGNAVQTQNTAQEGRRNAICGNHNSASVTVTGGRADGHCTHGDGSFNGHTVVKGGGAQAAGGSTAINNVLHQNTAQEGRQNNACANSNATGIQVAGGRAEGRCKTHDVSVNKHTVVKGRGAEAHGGSAGGFGSALEQNTAQEGRHNNNCARPNATAVRVSGGLERAHCVSKDGSFSHGTVVKRGGADANGGSSAAGTVAQQNTAQEGRHNNNCANPNTTAVTVTGGSARQHCKVIDRFAEIRSADIGEGAEANGGSGAADVHQQNTAQAGRNNNCANPNDSRITITGGRAREHCLVADGSFRRHSVEKHGGASANGGSGAAGTVSQQNTAQEGRHNNNCANSNGATVTLTGASAENRCKTIDHSVRVNTVDRSEGAEADGGSSVATLLQQNTAQEGRQNNTCGNANGATLTLSGGRTRTQCGAVDESVAVGSRYH
ncbi:hypothetical protein ACFW1M_38540 [Streptomyces inhibens]|uniref:hypothetical protein n=1 Tax=Streptomyces inhibens TaxID=2293571 RepID=UPI0036A60116